MSKSALTILHQGFEEMEAIAPIDILRRGGVTVTVASREPDLVVKGRNEITVTAELPLDEALKQRYDALILPGGPGVFSQLRGDQRVADALKHFAETDKLVCAICAAPVVLADAGLLAGKRFTSHTSTADELPGRDPERAVVEDNNLITSQGAGTATAFALAVLARLTNQAIADDVAASICLSTPQ
ncbi:MAG: DJ-1 family glyoxalase III [Verrucomicrobiota bacterium]